MKFIFLFFFFLITNCVYVFGQNSFSIKGIVVDTSKKSKLSNTSVAVINSKDSVLRKFTWTDENGSFNLPGLSPGQYILLLSRPTYADYVEYFKIDSINTVRDFGQIILSLKSKLLNEVIIRAKPIAIKIKGDTTEFNAKAYVIQPNDKVEDLLKQLPGIQIDKDGKITARGETVKKVLVDGEEFFSDDPTLVTQNIRADMVDKIQLYDKKSDQAAFTGIDDGRNAKTINIKLKDNKNSGSFGKLDAGGGDNGYNQEQILYNSFLGRRKFALMATHGNTGKTGLNWQDSQKFGDAGNTQINDNGDIIIIGSNDELDTFNGLYNGRGIPTVASSGVHFENKWDQDKKSFNSNYKIGSLDVEGTSNDLTQNNLQSGVINSDNNQKFKNYIFRQKLDATFQIAIDTSSNLKFSIGAADKNSKVDHSYLSMSRNQDSLLLNRSTRNVTNNSDYLKFDASAFYTKKMKKKGRTLSILFSQSVENTEAKGYLRSQIDFFNTQGEPDSSQFINQYKTNNDKSEVFNSSVTYTEPISNALIMLLNAGINVNISSSDRQSFDRSSSGNYDIIVPLLTNYLKLNQFSNRFGISFKYSKNKTTMSIGTKTANVSYTEVDGYTNFRYKRHFTNWFPDASFQYKISSEQTAIFLYSGTSNQPTISQIQPVINNVDPLNIYVGNPNLKPSFSNYLNLFYNSYRVLSGQGINLGSGFSFTSNPIINNSTIGSTGKSLIQYINLNNNVEYFYNFYGNFFRTIKDLDLNVGLNLNMAGNKYFSYINNVLNNEVSNTYSCQLTLSKSVLKKYDFNLNFGPTYNINQSSLHTNLNGNSAGFNSAGGINLYLPLKFQFGSDINYTYVARSESFNQDFNRTIWNASITKLLTKKDNLKFVLRCSDLLNQNSGFTRSAIANMITQSSYTTIRRYYMLSLVYDLNKMNAATKK